MNVWRRAGVVLLTVLALAVVAFGGDRGDQPRPEKGQRPGPEAMLAKFDTNHDGALSQDEMPERVWQHLGAADADHDGKLTADELKQFPGGGDKPDGMVTADEQKQFPGGGGDKPDPAAVFARLDKNGDGALTPDESGDRWQKLSGLDRDTDGAVSLEEFKQGRAPAGGGDKPDPAVLFGRLDVDGNGQLTAAELGGIWDRLSALDQDGDGGISLDEFRQAHPRGEQPDPAAAFGKLDTNGDGKLTAQEVGDRWDRLSKADKDGDGAITLDEFKAAHPGEAAGPGLFEKFDTDRDGALTKDEVPEKVWERVSAADQDGDGKVTPQELRASRAERPEGDQPGKHHGDKDARHRGHRAAANANV